MTATAKKLAATVCLLALIGITLVTASIGSPSEINVDANDGIFENYDGEVITFRWTADTISGSEEIRITHSEITDRLREGRVSEDFTMTIDNTISEAKYAVRDGGLQDGYDVDYQRQTWDWGRTWEAMPSVDERRSAYNEWGEENCDDIDGDGRNTWRYNEWQDGAFNSRLNGEVVCATQGSKHADIAELQSTPTEVMGATFTVMGDSVTITNEYQDSGSSRSATVGNSAKIDLLAGMKPGTTSRNRTTNTWRSRTVTAST